LTLTSPGRRDHGRRRVHDVDGERRIRGVTDASAAVHATVVVPS
jgi:hypothetical protein